MTVHQNLRDLRQISGLTQQEAAFRVGLTRQAISAMNPAEGSRMGYAPETR